MSDDRIIDFNELKNKVKNRQSHPKMKVFSFQRV